MEGEAMKPKYGESLPDYYARRAREVNEESRALLDAIGFGKGVIANSEHVPLKEFHEAKLAETDGMTDN